MGSLSEALAELYVSKSKDYRIGAESKSDRERFMKQLQRGFKHRVLDLSFLQCKTNVLARIPKMLRLVPRIRVLQLYNNLIKDAGLQRIYHIVSSEPQIVVLDIGANELTDDSYMRMIDIVKQTEIESLQLGRRREPSAQDNKYSTDVLVSIIQAVTERKKLTCFGISGTLMFRQKVAKQIAPHLSEMISSCEGLEALDISACGLLDTDQAVLAQALVKNTSLTTFRIGHNPFRRPWRMVDAVCHLEQLRWLDMSGCSLGEENVRIFADRFDYGWGIIRLDLSENPIGDDGVAELLMALCDNDTVCELYLRDTGITGDIADDVREYLSKTPVLHQLDISNNNLGDEIALALADVLPVQDTLVVLNVEGCRITGSGGVAIFEALTENTTLKRINVRNNFLGESAVEILGHLQQNETLMFVDMTSNKVDVFAMDALDALIKRNKQGVHDKKFADLKRDYLRLKIQNARIPLLSAELDSLHVKESQIGEEIDDIENKQYAYESDSNYDLVSVRNQIKEYEKMIAAEQEQMAGTEHLIDDTRKASDEAVAETKAKTFLEKSVFERTDGQVKQLEEETEQFIASKQAEEEDLRRQIDVVEQMIKEISEALQSDDVLREYAIPEYPFADEIQHLDASDLDPLVMPLKEVKKTKKGKRKVRKPSPTRRKRTQGSPKKLK